MTLTHYTFETISHLSTKVDKMPALNERQVRVLKTFEPDQFARRNLSAFARAELALKLEPLIAAKAKVNLKTSTGGKAPQPLQNSAKAGKVDTRAELAQVAGISHDTIHKAGVISKKAPEEVKEKLRTGDLSVNEVYQGIKKTERQEKQSKPRNGCGIKNHFVYNCRQMPNGY